MNKIIISLFLVVSSFGYSMEYKDIDGIPVYALEDSSDFQANEVVLGIAYLPFDPFYSYYGLKGSYTRFFNTRWGWEVINFAYAAAVDKSLRNELAEEYGATNEESVPRTEFTVSSHIKYNVSYGKSILFDKYIRRSKVDILAGVGSVTTNRSTQTSLNLGIQYDQYISKDFTIKFEFLDMIPVTQLTDFFLKYASFSVGIARRF